MTQDTERPEEDASEPEASDDIEIELLGEESAEAEPSDAAPPETEPASAPESAELPAVRETEWDADPNTLVIESEDLLDVDDTMPAAAPDSAELPLVDYMPAVGAPLAKKGKGDLFSGGLVGSMLLQMLLAGAIGGLLAWGALEPSARAHENSPFAQQSGFGMLVDMAAFGGIMGGLIGLALGAVEGIVVAAWTRAATGAALGMLIGGAGGAVGGVFGQLIFSLILSGGGIDPGIELHSRVMAARALGWAFVGAFVGLGPGVMMMAPKKMLNGLLGGLAGGFIAGILFDPIGIAFGAVGSAGGTPSRLIGITVLGLCTGCGIGLVEEMRKQAWIIIIAGPLVGKQFIIYKPATWIGSAPGMDIPLVKDKSIAPKHCVLEAAGPAYALRSLVPGQTLVNGREVSAHRLTDGDVIHLGQTGLQYHTRPLVAGPIPEQPY